MRYVLLSCLVAVVSLLSFRSLTGFTVQGKVTDDKGNPVAGASVNEKGSSTAATTNTSGDFSITVSNEKSVLIFSAVGFDKKEIPVNGKASLNITLKTANQALQEVVVVGYGVARKKSVSGSVTTITPGYYRQPNARYYNKAPATSGWTNKNLLPEKERRKINHAGDEKDDGFNTEDYDGIVENRFLTVAENALSTFSIDVDAASYSNVRRFLQQGQLPPAGAVRIEEMINYFHYNYPQPLEDAPFSINTEMAACPWNTAHRLVLVGLQGKKIPVENLPPFNIVFLIDVSGSMMDQNKLPLVKASLKLLTDQLREQDKVSLVVYAGNAGLVLPATSGAEKTKIKDAIDKLEAGGSTAGGQGIRLAYKTVQDIIAYCF